MKDFLMWVVVIIGTLAILVWVIGEANEKEAGRLYARAHVIETNDQARQNLLSVLMPYVVISVSIIGGTVAVIALTVFGVAIIHRLPPPPRRPERIVERHTETHRETRTILILQPGQHSRREVYRLLNGGNENE